MTMMHTHETPITRFLDEFIAGGHHCCVDASVEAWTQILRSERFQDFFTKIVYMSCEKHLNHDHNAILTFSEHFAPIALQIMISSLSIGTVAGVSTIYQAAHELESILSEAFKPEFIAIMKRGPKGTV